MLYIIGGEQVSKRQVLSANEVEEIIAENYDAIYRYCYWKIGNSADAQDMTQETFMRFVQSLPDYRNQGKPQALLYTIARNQCINWYKKVKPTSLDEAQSLMDEGSNARYEQVETKLSLQRQVSGLPEEQQEVLLLRYGQELKIEDIAAITGTSRFAVMYLIKKALETLKRTLNKGDLF